jgi:peroxiredoxin
MRHSSMALALALTLAAVAVPVAAQQAGSQAPDFTLGDTAGNPVRLSDYRGRFVVLEWTNPECPFVQSHYQARSMQGLQKKWGAQDVVWLTINSTSQQHPEYKSAAAMSGWTTTQGALPKAVLIDATSAVGRAYAAKTTPHMFVIDPSGKVVYDGAIDDHRSARASAHNATDNFVSAALTEATAGRPVRVASTQPYGCSIKY